jgi:predicted ABC-type ATPase
LELAERFDYQKIIVFIGLKSVELSKERVNQRVKRNGHFVPESEIEFRYTKGLELLDDLHERFDLVRIHESMPNYRSLPCVAIENNRIGVENIPSFIHMLPTIKEKIQRIKTSQGIRFGI